MSVAPFIPVQRAPVRLGNALAPALLKLGALPQLGRADDLLEAAIKSTGLSDFGDPSFREPLELLLGDIAGDPDLHPMGRFFHREFLLRFLKNRLKLVEAWSPESAALQEVAQPLVILGMPRTGTTRLFNIMARDPAHRTLSLWESYRPTPAPREESLKSDRRRMSARMDQVIANYLGPDMRAIHELRLDGPEECIHLLATSFVSWLLSVEYNAPQYHEFYLSHDQILPYQEFRKTLHYLQSHYKRDRWLLKSPTHSFGIFGLMAAFPEARIVQTHRDPVKVIPSTASMALTARGMGCSQLDASLVGAQVLEQLTCALERTMEARVRIPTEQIADIQYADIIGDPMNVVREIYQKFGWSLSDMAIAEMTDEINSHGQHKHGRHHYTLEQFGYERGKIDATFADYRAAFDVPSEP